MLAARVETAPASNIAAVRVPLDCSRSRLQPPRNASGIKDSSGGPRRLDRQLDGLSVFCKTIVRETGAEDEKKAQESFGDIQSEGRCRRLEGRQDPGGTGRAVRCSPEPDYRLETTVA